MSPPHAPRPPGSTGGRAENGGAGLDDDDSRDTPQGYVLRGDQLEPQGVPAFRDVPDERADRNHSPAPDWVSELIDSSGRKTYPAKKGERDNRRHHVNVWELLVRRLPLRSNAKLVATVLAESWPTIRPGLAKVSTLTSLSRTSVNHGIYMLVNAGLLRIESRTGETTVYVPTYPERAITGEEVDLAFQWRRMTKGGSRPGPVGVRSSCGTRSPGDQPPDPVGAPPDPLGNSTRPPGGHEVCNEATKEVRAEVLALGAGHPEGVLGMKRDQRLAATGVTR